jgi:CDP-glucose 4,6-dehydratase
MVSRKPQIDWSGRRVFLTGHTGFKGSWLALWLHRMGAEVHGYALDPSSETSLFHTLDLGTILASDTRADLADQEKLATAMKSARPEIVLHLAAQALVRAGYQDPMGTFTTNILGTAHVLEAMRNCPEVRAAVIVTTDKVYENREWSHPYRENDPLGGHDPYSASKAGAEIITASMRDSFFHDHQVAIATARAGNVIGGGDWADDRLVPDCLRAFASEKTTQLRYPDAVRPWQHVLEPLDGYLTLAAALFGDDGKRFARAWNFGPDTAGNVTVGEVATRIANLWGDRAQVEFGNPQGHPHEAGLLTLDHSLARRELNWKPRWNLDTALTKTVEWHRAWLEQSDMREFTAAQITDYTETSHP